MVLLDKIKANKNEYRVLKIPFASKRSVSKIVKASKDAKYDFKGIAYYLFDSKNNIVHNSAKLTYVRNFADKSESDSKFSKKDFMVERNEIISDSCNFNLKALNRVIEKHSLTVGNSYSIVTGSTARGAFIGSNFGNSEIIYFDETNSIKYNGWRFSTALSSGHSKAESKIKIWDKTFTYKYSKTKNNSKFKKPSEIIRFNYLDKLPQVTFEQILDSNSEIKRLMMIFNMDLLDECDWIEYENEIKELKRMNKNLYPKRVDLQELIAGIILKSFKNVNDEKTLESFRKLVSSHRVEFRNSMLKKFGASKKEMVLNNHQINQVCEAAHFLDVKYIKQKIFDDVINNDEIVDEIDKLKEIANLLEKIADSENGMFMDPTTHKYFDKNLIIIDSSTGKIIDRTKTGIYSNIKIDLSESQKSYLKERNNIRVNDLK